MVNRSSLVLGALLLLLAGSFTATQADPVPVTVDAVRLEMLGATARVTGSLRAVSRAGVATQEPGLIVSVEVDVGGRVGSGDVLARLDDRRLRAELAALDAERKVAEARQREAEANAEFARTDFRRVEGLRAGGTASEIEFVRVRTELDAAEARISAAQQTVARIQSREELLRIRVRDMEIKAPFDGVVTERAVDPGEWLSAGDPVATIVSTGVHEAWLEIPERYVADLVAHGKDLRVETAATDQPLAVERVRLAPEIDPRVRTFMAIVDVSGSDLVAGMSVSAWVPTSATDERTTVHKDALVRDPGGFLVFAARPRGTGHVATPIPVKIAFETQTRVALLPGALRAGDLVVIEGNERLFAGVPIRLNNGPASTIGESEAGGGA